MLCLRTFVLGFCICNELFFNVLVRKSSSEANCWVGKVIKVLNRWCHDWSAINTYLYTFSLCSCLFVCLLIDWFIYKFIYTFIYHFLPIDFSTWQLVLTRHLLIGYLISSDKVSCEHWTILFSEIRPLLVEKQAGFIPFIL